MAALPIGRVRAGRGALPAGDKALGGAWEARLGLGWSLLLQGERGEAEGIFERLAADAPGDARAAEGLRAARARVAVIAAPRAALTGQLYPDAGA